MIRTPKNFEGQQGAPNALRLKALLGVISAGWTAFFIQHMITGFYRIAIVDAATVALTLMALWWGVSSGEDRRLRLGAHLAIVVSCGGIVGVAMFSGQQDAMATWYLTAVPLFAAYQLGARPAVVWAAICLALMAGVYVSGTFIDVEPDYVPDAQIWFMGKIILLFVLLGLAVATRRASDAYLTALKEREAIIRQRAEELAQARDEALEAVRAKNQFVANISHEIRTPLHGVIGMTSVLLDAEQPPKEREMVKTIQRSSTALLAILNDVLDFSKLEAGAVEPEAIPLDLLECVEDVVDLFAKAAAERDLDMYVMMERDTPRWVEGDITYLRQVLLNLVGNAVKFTEEGEVWVRVSREADDVLHFEVHDTGIGIPETKVEGVFESFSQVDTSTTRKYGGTGLGLAISKRLVNLMGGRIWLESRPGAGSTFHFTIGAHEVEPPDRPSTTSERASLIGVSAKVLGGPEGTRKSIIRTLELLGANPKVVETVDEIPEEDDEAPVIVFQEEHAAELAGRASRPPVVLVAEVDDLGARDRASRLGLDAVLFRPVRHRALFDALVSIDVGELSARSTYTTFDPTLGERLPARILVAEDNPVNQRVAVTVLEKLGYTPDVAGNGAEVLDALELQPYDILFMDLQMPDMDGLEATRRVRAEFGDQPWIVAMTASVNKAQRERVAQSGMNDFMGKPFDVRTLMAAIERWATQAGAADAPPVMDPWADLQAMFADSPTTLASLIRTHLENSRNMIDEITKALADGDLEAVSRNAHTLKSSSAQFGSRVVSKCAQSIETASVEGASVEELRQSLEAIEEAWSQAEARLGARCEELEARSAPPRAAEA